jgi:hypothetical protein
MSEYGSLKLTLKTLRSRFLGIPDVNRWQNLGNHDPVWDERTQPIANLIPPGSRVVEFGAGRRQLEQYLDPSCTYVPSDLVSRGADTIVCDLNAIPRPDFTDLNLDVAVFGGVLEYVRDVSSLAAWLSGQVSMCVASYVCARSQPKTWQRMQETIERISFGWVNTYTAEELKTIFQAGGFPQIEQIVKQTSYGEENLFVFKR